VSFLLWKNTETATLWYNASTQQRQEVSTVEIFDSKRYLKFGKPKTERKERKKGRQRPNEMNTAANPNFTSA